MSESAPRSRTEARSPVPVSRFAAAAAGAAIIAAAALFAADRSQAQTTAAVAAASVNLNQRAGPATSYPVLQVVPAGGQVTLYGCIGGFAWCDGVHRGTRGWLSADYLRVWYQGQYVTLAQYANLVSFPVVAFNLDVYWGRYYQNQPFYPDRARWVASPGVSVGIQVGSFYNRLSPHGRWVWVNGRNVWTPRVDADWRPYTDGRWVYNRRHGWTWVSNEPFGWATYHYGRWAYSHRIGWFWVPGTRWAPAWVSWRQSGDHIAWAPMPPDPTDSFSFGISYGNTPNYYWQAVPANQFLSINLNFNIIRDREQTNQVIATTAEIGAVSEDDNAVVNQALAVEFVEEATQEEVVPVELALTSESEVDEVEDGTVQIFSPPPEEDVAAEPEEVATVEEVEAESETAGQAPVEEPDTEDQVPPPPAPDEVPPASESPPMAGQEPTDETVTTDPIEPDAIVCPEGSVLQDGECVMSEAPPPPPPVTEEEPTEAPVESEPAPATADEPPATEEPPPEAPATEEAPAATDEPPPPPAVEEPPPAPAEQPPPPPVEEPPPPPPPPPAEEPPPPPPAEEPPPAAEEPPPPPPAAEPAPQCPEGLVLQPDGTCAEPAQ